MQLLKIRYLNTQLLKLRLLSKTIFFPRSDDSGNMEYYGTLKKVFQKSFGRIYQMAQKY
jgi:hypothetical protein